MLTTPLSIEFVKSMWRILKKSGSKGSLERDETRVLLSRAL
jgi:hypothetical protein